MYVYMLSICMYERCIYMMVYDYVVVLDIFNIYFFYFSSEDLTGHANNLMSVSKQVLLVIHVYFQETISSEPVLSSYCAIRVSSMLRQG